MLEYFVRKRRNGDFGLAEYCWLKILGRFVIHSVVLRVPDSVDAHVLPRHKAVIP